MMCEEWGDFEEVEGMTDEHCIKLRQNIKHYCVNKSVLIYS